MKNLVFGLLFLSTAVLASTQLQRLQSQLKVAQDQQALDQDRADSQALMDQENIDRISAAIAAIPSPSPSPSASAGH